MPTEPTVCLPENNDQLIALLGDLSPAMQRFYRGLVSGYNIAPGALFTHSLIEQLHRDGENILALMVIERSFSEAQLLRDNANSHQSLLLIKIKVLHALHNYERARNLAQALAQQLTVPSVQVTGNLASVIKSQALDTHDRKQQQILLRESQRLYSTVFDEPRFNGSFWLGVNALALAICTQQTALVHAHLETVRQQCLRSTTAAGSPDFWVLATLAELSLIELLANQSFTEQSLDAVADAYAKANAACSALHERKSARKNVRLLLAYGIRDDLQLTGTLQALVDRALRPARIAVFSGHRIDAPDRDVPRFPPERIDSCSVALNDWVSTEHIDVGFTSAASGADLLFIDALLDHHRSAQIVLPFSADQFRESTLTSDGNDNTWTERFDRLTRGERVGAVLWNAGQTAIDTVGMDPYYAHANRVILGMGRLKAAELDGELMACAVMEPGNDALIGGTHAAFRAWREVNLSAHYWSPVSNVWSTPAAPELNQGLPTPQDAALAAAPPPPDRDSAHQHSTVSRTMLFADVIGFSQFTDTQIAGFCDGVLGSIKALVAQAEHPPLELNTWGDGLFMVFESATAGAEFALKLCGLMTDSTEQHHWQRLGAPADMAMRVSLHSSPVRQLINPLTGEISHWGHNVNLAARIEPVTPPNQVYGSAATAALIAAEGSTHITADFVGMVPLAKRFGTLELFRLRHHPQ